MPASDEDRGLTYPIDEMNVEYGHKGGHSDESAASGHGVWSEPWNKGRKVGKSHVRTLMKRIGIEALNRKPASLRLIPSYKSIPISSEG